MKPLRWYDYLFINANWFALTLRSQVLAGLLIPLSASPPGRSARTSSPKNAPASSWGCKTSPGLALAPLEPILAARLPILPAMC